MKPFALFITLLALTGVTLASLPGTARAEGGMPCGTRDSVLSQLKDKYHETGTGVGMTGNGAVIELMTSESGTWTLLLTMPSGKSCMIATGDNWEQSPVKAAGKDA